MVFNLSLTLNIISAFKQGSKQKITIKRANFEHTILYLVLIITDKS